MQVTRTTPRPTSHRQFDLRPRRACQPKHPGKTRRSGLAATWSRRLGSQLGCEGGGWAGSEDSVQGHRPLRHAILAVCAAWPRCRNSGRADYGALGATARVRSGRRGPASCRVSRDRARRYPGCTGGAAEHWPAAATVAGTGVARAMPEPVGGPIPRTDRVVVLPGKARS